MTYDKTYAQEVLGAKCGECPLRVGGTFVPSVGPASASVAFVGEAPGVQEARGGVPFVGPSGKLLDLVNDQYGIKREEVFLTNACLCRPADGTNPGPAAVTACRPRLLAELRDHQSSTVVALGNKASLALLGVEGVTKLRVGPGRTSPYPIGDGESPARIIPTLHPAACLRQPDMFPSLIKDIGKVVIPQEPWVEPIITVVDDPVEAVRVLKEIEVRAGDLDIDIEVDIDKDTSFDHPDRYGLLCVGMSWEPESATVIGENACASEEVLDAMYDAFMASNLGAQNGKFDLSGLFPKLGALALDFDTLLASYALDERPGIHGLKHMLIETLGAPQYDEEIAGYVKGHTDEDLEEYAGYGRIPRPILYKYCGYDVCGTHRLRRHFTKLLEAGKKPTWWDEMQYPYEFKNLRYLHDFLVKWSNEIMFQELNGMAIDRTYGNELTGKYMESLGKIEADINKILVDAGYQPINPRSVPQVKAALKFFKINAESTNEDTLKIILEKTEEESARHQFAKTLLVHRREAKMYGTYVKGTIKRMYKGRVYPTVRLHGTTTGRPACRNPNLFNVPRESAIKQLYVPSKEGNVFVQGDYAQAELRVLSWLAQDNYFRDILNDPTRDLFDELTGDLYPSMDKATTDPGLWKDVRVRIKAFVYGLNYGRTYYSIASEFKMSEREAKDLANRFMNNVPEIRDFQDRVQDSVKKGRDLINPFGRHRRFPLITKESWESVKKEALAFLPQSTSSDVCNMAYIALRQDIRGSGAFIRNSVYDSILVECPADMADEIAFLLDKRMVEAGQNLVGDYIDFRTDTKVGKHWGEV